MKSAWLVWVVPAVLAACSSGGDGGSSQPHGGDGPAQGNDPSHPAQTPPPAPHVCLTDGCTIVPTHSVNASFTKASSDPAVLGQWLDQGYGGFITDGPGEPLIPEGTAPPASGPNRRRLARFVQMTDLHVTDDESPTRVASLDGGPPLESAFRPQEGYECRVVNAAIRTVNRINREAPLDFVLLGGDTIDSAQQNELDWALALLGGADSVACDSGNPDDPVPGPNNDGKDPFVPEGLDVPWYWVTGNHDVLIQGNFAVNALNIAESKGAVALGGTRDYTRPGAPLSALTVPDARRAAMMRADLIDRVAAHTGKAGPAAHGLGDYAKKSKKAFYTVDLGNSGIRLMAVDTAAETGGADGVIHQSDVDAFVKPELARAKADHKMVIIASHHAGTSITNGSDLGGILQLDAVTQRDWESLLTGSPQVIAHLAGHLHQHTVRRVDPAVPGAGGYWEVRTSAIVDYPHQFRVTEIWDEDDGYLTIRSTAVNYEADQTADPVAYTGRTLGILDYTSHGTGGGPGQAADRNVILWTKKPQL